MTFFVTQEGQNVPASEAAQNYQKLSKAQLGSFIDLEVSVSILGIPRLNKLYGKCCVLLNRLQKMGNSFNVLLFKLVA